LLAYVSIYEGFGMPLIEANAVGRPVLASDIEPIKSVAANAALLVNPYNTGEIREGIVRLLNDKDLCHRLIENGLKNAAKYTAESVSKQYLAVYQKMMAEQ
jgi:glycosyltransferase involved in cell wall biosynthesis